MTYEYDVEKNVVPAGRKKPDGILVMFLIGVFVIVGVIGAIFIVGGGSGSLKGLFGVSTDVPYSLRQSDPGFGWEYSPDWVYLNEDGVETDLDCSVDWSARRVNCVDVEDGVSFTYFGGDNRRGFGVEDPVISTPHGKGHPVCATEIFGSVYCGYKVE